MTDQSVHPEAARWGGWSWRAPRYGEHYRTCSYCGSINPEDLVAEENWAAQWADRKYGWPHKFYVDIVNRDPSTLFIISRTNREPSERERASGWIATADLTREQETAATRDGWRKDGALDDRHWWLFGERRTHHGKFYTVHLSDAGLDPATKNTIERRSGLEFTFEDGRVAWKSTPVK